MRRGLVLVLLVAAAWAAPAAASPATVEVVVTLPQPSLARAVEDSRALSAAVKRRRLSLSSPTSAAYLRDLAREQDVLAARIERRIPGARVRWRYRVVLNGLAVVVPNGDVPRLAAVPGVARVLPAVRYGVSLETSPSQIGAPALWTSSVASTGAGMKIAVLDDGVDQKHPFFAPAGYTMPAGFPRGNAAFTTAKVIVAKAFPPASPRWRHAAKPFDPDLSDHGTHVAGIAAGNAGVVPAGRRNALPVSGVAPAAYIGNYKVLTVPTSAGVGLNGNSPEIAAGIEEAVKDGMDVVNLSLGEPEIEPTRDIVVQAIDAAAAAGVVVTVAAGNDGSEFGSGSVSSPGTAAGAITVGAAASCCQTAAFSSVGPTPLSLRLKPDVAAPGVEITSSVPAQNGLWASFSGTSMAAPHVAGGAALLLQRHPTWTPAQIKSALVQTASPLDTAPVTGGGFVNLLRADEPLLFAEPSAVSFGLLERAKRAAITVALADAGGGAGEWSVAVDSPGDPAVTVAAPASVTVPGGLTLTAAATGAAAAAEHTGFVTLRRGDAVRRIPYWLRISARQLSRHRTTPLRRPGVYRGNTVGRPALVSDYRYPEGASRRFSGPEQVFRVTITRPAANFGVVLLSRGRGVRVQARVTFAGNENRLVGYTSLPFNLNPYLESFMAERLAAGAVLPRPGAYDVVFDSPDRATAGRFTFRFWVDDVTPPRLRLLDRAVRRGRPVRVAASDSGSGIDPASSAARIDDNARTVTIRQGVVRVDTTGLAPGRHRLVLQVSDNQETRNMENVARILPNTRRLELSFTVRR